MHKNLIMYIWDSCPIHVFYLIHNCNHYIYENAKILQKHNLASYKWIAYSERTQAIQPIVWPAAALLA